MARPSSIVRTFAAMVRRVPDADEGSTHVSCDLGS